ncbi:hypothetical protein E2C01_094902 [Portunus trituberculatus]|uniref:Uncharacterized protein n=1 Tax=Portunus trituberculatus TaxID=210409 RepID=A0A5B7JY48_PORTR|nr:hypothetical protein [Portunus trituberculatus]
MHASRILQGSYIPQENTLFCLGYLGPRLVNEAIKRQRRRVVARLGAVRRRCRVVCVLRDQIPHDGRACRTHDTATEEGKGEKKCQPEGRVATVGVTPATLENENN